jgi:PAS domain S-box-containing protein
MVDLRRRYTKALTHYLNAGGEAALSEGYELAREAVGQGVRLLDLVDFHGSAIAEYLASRSDADAERVNALPQASAFLAECLAPYAMSFGGLQSFGQQEHSKAEQAAVERSEALATLAATEKLYSVMFENSPIAMIFSDEETNRVLEANPAAVRAYGYSKGEFGRLELFDYLALGPDQDMAALMSQRRDAGDVIRYGPISHRRKDGSTMRVLVTSFKVTYGDRPARVALIEDVTEKEKLERQINQSQRLESLGQLAGGIAHDFNNLLGVIINFALFAKEKVVAATELPDGEHWRSTVQDIERVERAAQSAARLTHQLLAFARREVIQAVPIDINAVVAELVPLLNRTIGEHVELRWAPGNSPWRTLLDAGQLEQVIMNLAVNARDAMPSGGILNIDTANVNVDEAYASGRPGLETGRYVRLTISDTGSGMDKATLQRAFEPFFTTKESGKGTGLGLSTVYGIVNQAGGHVAIYSEVGMGTRVTTLFPATDQRPIASVEEAAPRRRFDASVLIVEDADDIREVASRILTRNGFKVLVAAGGAEAVKIAEEYPGEIDLLLSDVVMPQMQGKEVAERVSTLRPTIRVLYMSGYAMPTLAPSGTLDPGVVVLEKPFTEPQLLAKIRDVMNGAS